MFKEKSGATHLSSFNDTMSRLHGEIFSFYGQGALKRRGASCYSTPISTNNT